jgi:hypothetical protein
MEMKRPTSLSKARALVPVWAQRIVVERESQGPLLIRGWGRIGDNISTARVAPDAINRIDLFERFRRDYLKAIGKETRSQNAGVYRFAAANDDEKLVGFCEEFGPVCGDVVLMRCEDDLSFTIKVSQSLDKLRESQRTFRAAVRLVREANQGGRANRTEIYDAATVIYRNLALTTGTDAAGMLALIEMRRRFARKQSIEKALSFAHETICGMLNGFPPNLVPVDGEVIELPTSSDTGIESVLYYQLRRDYLAGREIGICKECGCHFPVFKHPANGCSDSCRRALRNRKYWKGNRKKINRERRRKTKERK